MKRFALALLLIFFCPMLAHGQVNPITGNITAAGNCAAISNANCVIQTLPANASSVTVTVGNTFSATLAPEQTGDSGNTWTSAGSSITSPGVTTYTISSKNGFRVRASAYASGTATVTIAYSTGGSGGGAPSGPAGGALCSGSTYPNPLDCTPIASYTFSVSSGTITATPNIPSGTIYSGTDLRAVWDSVAAAIPNGGTVWFKNGTYPCNTLDQESTGGFSNYYCVGIPSGGASQYAQWFLVGESSVPIIDQFGAPVQTNGVIINMTSTAVSSVPAHSKIMNVWARPDVANGIGVSVYLSNLDLRVPTNQRGCETESDLSQGLNAGYTNVLADTAVAQNLLAFPVEDSCTSWGGSDPGGLIGLTSTNSVKERSYFTDSVSEGADVGLDIRGEHTRLIDSFGINANHGIDFGVRGPAILAASNWVEAGCVTTARCLTLGANAAVGSQLNIGGLYFEDTASGSFVPVYHAKETTPGNSYGLITVQNISETTGPLVRFPVFDGGGGKHFISLTEDSSGLYSLNSNNSVIFGDSTGSTLGNLQFLNAPGAGTATAKMVLYVGYIGESALGIANKLAFGTDAALYGAYDYSGNFAWGYSTPYPTNFSHLFNIGTSGQFNVGSTGNLATSGSVTFTGLTNAATGDYVCYNAGLIEFNTATCTLSLAKYKMDIAPLHQSLNEVMRLRPVEYRYKPELKLGNRLQVGLIADEVAKVDPRIGAYKDNGELESVDYEHMTAVLVSAMQEQQREIAILKRQVSALRRTKRP